MNIGDIYWITSNEGISHPQVVIESVGDKLTVVSITTNMKKIEMPGNVLLDLGEGELEKQSIVEVSKVLSINKSQLKEYIGSLSSNRVNEIKNGIGFIDRSYRH